MGAKSNHKTAFPRFLKTAGKRALRVAQLTGTRTAQKLVIFTPVDTGEARGNWLADLNTVPQEHDPKRLSPTGAESIQAAKDVLTKLKLGDVFVLANSAPHIFPLEYGHSKQASQGMRDVVFALMPRIAEEAAKEAAGGRI